MGALLVKGEDATPGDRCVPPNDHIISPSRLWAARSYNVQRSLQRKSEEEDSRHRDPDGDDELEGPASVEKVGHGLSLLSVTLASGRDRGDLRVMSPNTPIPANPVWSRIGLRC